jgi:hypothetical protein
MNDAPAFTSGLDCGDALARYWLSQVALRLRREVCWLWRERTLQGAPAGAPLPASVDPALAALDGLRYESEKRRFFAEDEAARHLSGRIAAGAAPAPQAARASFGWLVAELDLAPVECFVLAAALLPTVDSAAGPVVACCHNDAARTVPSFALVQRLWNQPGEVLRCMVPGHPLFSHGLLATAPEGADNLWQAPLQVPALVARALLHPEEALPPAFDTVTPAGLPSGGAAGRAAAAAAAAITAGAGTRIVPLHGAAGAPLAGVAAACAAGAGVSTVRIGPGLAREHLAQVMTLAWLRGLALYLDASVLSPSGEHAAPARLPLPALPLLVFVGLRAGAPGVGGALPGIEVDALGYGERLACWRGVLPVALADLAPELARRFRHEAATIARIGAELAALPQPPGRGETLAAARAGLDLGALAQPVTPRFVRADLMLPPPQSAQVDELLAAMRNLTRVHYDWGTARAWNEAGLAVLFSGPPGTGKTMAAEVVAAELALPLYRIDLSQVVNKYVGETEKNLRLLFDAADASDLVLFFDEADALFGKRSEVKDAHDRYANLEISYLLERMERFKGLAILATNRRKDLDEAFLRRLRFAIDFPMPGPEERLRIWRGALPPTVDPGDLDFAFLAQRFPLAGGHIRGIVFHACLQSASEGAPRRLSMGAVLRALQREYDKLERANSLDQFGPYADLVAAQRSGR